MGKRRTKRQLWGESIVGRKAEMELWKMLRESWEFHFRATEIIRKRLLDEKKEPADPTSNTKS